MGSSGKTGLMLNVQTISGSNLLLGNQDLGATGEISKSFGLLSEIFSMQIFSFLSLEK
jgi:hypothetical protein